MEIDNGMDIITDRIYVCQVVDKISLAQVNSDLQDKLIIKLSLTDHTQVANNSPFQSLYTLPLGELFLNTLQGKGKLS